MNRSPVSFAMAIAQRGKGEKCAKKKFSCWKSSGGAETRRLYWLRLWRLLLIVSGCLYHPKYHVLLLRRQLPELLHKRAFSFREPIVLDGGLCFFAQKLTGGYAQIVGQHLDFFY